MNNVIRMLNSFQISDYFTKDNITFILATIGSLGTIYCVYIPVTVVEHTRHSGKELLSHREELSIQFPISLSSLAGTSGYLFFDKLPDSFPDAPTTLTLEVSTNRGRAKKMKLSVPNL